MTADLLDAPLPELMARAAPDPRRGARDEGHLLAQGVHPADDAVPRQVRLLHVRPAAGSARSALPHARRRCSRSRAPAPAPAATRRCSRSASAPSCATPSPQSGSPPTATRRRSTTSSRCARLVLDETGLLPHANAGALYPRRARGTAGGRHRVAGDDARVAQPRPRLPPRLARQDARAPARHARRRGRALQIPFTTGILVGIGESRADRVAALEAIADSPPPPRARAGGHRPELPAEAGTAMHAAPPCPPDEYLEAIAAGPRRSCPPTSTCRRRRTCPTTSACCSTPASTTGAASPR